MRESWCTLPRKRKLSLNSPALIVKGSHRNRHVQAFCIVYERIRVSPPNLTSARVIAASPRVVSFVRLDYNGRARTNFYVTQHLRGVCSCVSLIYCDFTYMVGRNHRQVAQKCRQKLEPGLYFLMIIGEKSV